MTLLVFLFIGLAALKKTKAELEILTEINALMIEKGIIGGTCHGIPWYVKANNKCMKSYDRNILSIGT